MAEKITKEEAEALMNPPPSPPEVKEEALPPESGLEILGPEPEVLHLSIGDVPVSPMKMKQIRKFLSIAEKLLPAIKEALGEGKHVNLTAVMNADQDAFLQAIAIASGLTVEKIDDLMPDEFIRLVTKVFVCNLDFFVRTLPSVLGMAEGSVLKAVTNLSKGGATPFIGSFHPGTGLKT